MIISIVNIKTSSLLLKRKTQINKYHFIDVFVDNSGTRLIISVCYRKKMFTRVLINYLSYTSISYTIGLVKCLIDRVFRINNTWIGFDKDLGVVLKFLRKNAYPEHLLSKITRNYLHKKLKMISNDKKRSADERFFKLPYIGQYSLLYKNKLN